MSPAMTRRGLVKAAGAAIGAAAAGVPAPVMASSAPHPDAALLDLIARHAEVDAAYDRADAEDARLGAVARAAYPPRPDALWWKGFDLFHDLGGTATGRAPCSSDRVRVFYTLDDVERLQKAGPSMRWSAVDCEHPEPCPREVDPAGEARRREIVATSDRWQAECRAIDASSGWDAVSEAVCDLGDKLAEMEAEILATAPTTPAGLATKGRWASRPDLNDVTAGLWARQVVADAVAMAERGALGGAA